MAVTVGTFALRSGTGAQFVDAGLAGITWGIVWGTFRTAAGYGDGIQAFIGMWSQSGGTGSTSGVGISSQDAADPTVAQTWAGNDSLIRVDDGAGTALVAADYAGATGAGFNLTVNTAEDGILVNYVVGTDADADVGRWTKRTTAGKDSIALAFAYAAALFLPSRATADSSSMAHAYLGFGAAVGTAQQWANWYSDFDNVATSNAGYRVESAAAIATTTAGGDNDSSTGVLSDATASGGGDGFQVNWTLANGSAEREGYLAFGPSRSFWAGTVTGPTTTGDFDVTAIGFQPEAYLILTPYHTAGQPEGTHGAWMMGGADAAGNQAVITLKSSHGAGAANTHQAQYADRVVSLGPIGFASSNIEATHAAMLANGVRLNFSAADAAFAPEFYVFAWGSAAADHPLAGDVVAAAAVSASGLVLAHPLAGAATGASTAAASDLAADHALAGAATGATVAQASGLVLAHPLAGGGAAASVVAGTGLVLAHPLAGGSAAAATLADASLTLPAETAPFRVGFSALGGADAIGGQGTLAVTEHPLAGAVVAASALTGEAMDAARTHALTGAVASAVAADATRITVGHALVGSATGAGATGGGVTLGHPLAGSVAGAAAALASRLVAAHALVGGAAGASAGQATGFGAASHPLAGAVVAAGTAAGAGLPSTHPLAGAVVGAASLAGNMPGTHALTGALAGASAVTAAGVVVTTDLAGAAIGAATTTARLFVPPSVVVVAVPAQTRTIDAGARRATIVVPASARGA